MTRNNDQSRVCKYCGNMHQRGRCPAYGRMCNKCRKWNHFASVCQSKSVNNIEQEQSSSDERNENDVTMPWTIPILTCGTNVSYKLDTGSQVNIIPQNTYHALQKKPKLCTATEKLMAHDGNAIPVIGKSIVNLARKGKPSIPAQMFVVPTDSSPIIGLETCQRLNLIKRVEILNCDHANFMPSQYVFGEIGYACLESIISKLKRMQLQ